MLPTNLPPTPDGFTAALYDLMKQLNPGIDEMELYEFRYALNNITPEQGWASVDLDPPDDIDRRINDRAFYTAVELKTRREGKIVLDDEVLRLTRMLLVGLVDGTYALDWIKQRFYFDIRGFYFLVRITYLTPEVRARLGGRPMRAFEKRQTVFERSQDVGYKAFRAANAEIDQAFIECVLALIARKGAPIVIAIAGATAAGKTEIVDRLRIALEGLGQRVTAIEMDNFLTDRDYREARGIGTLGAQAIHADLFKRCLQDLLHGRSVSTPRYDFINATSSHDLSGRLKPEGVPVPIAPADIIFIEGNFPFLLDDIAPLIGIKVVYLTDDAVRLKRKWKRDIDYRKKYDYFYLCNRYFKDQFLMAQTCYLPQLQNCDICVDTTGAALWATPEIEEAFA